MTTKYKSSSDVPTNILCNRLEELSCAIANGKDSRENEFTMRIPAECDRDSDLVLREAARRILELEKRAKDVCRCGSLHDCCANTIELLLCHTCLGIVDMPECGSQ